MVYGSVSVTIMATNEKVIFAAKGCIRDFVVKFLVAPHFNMQSHIQYIFKIEIWKILCACPAIWKPDNNH